MKCKQILEILDFYADGELGPLAALRVRSHLARCAGCRRELSRVNYTRRMLTAAPVAEPPSGLRAAILEAARAQESSRPAKHSPPTRERGAVPARGGAPARRFAWAAAGGAAVCILAVLAVARTLIRPPQGGAHRTDTSTAVTAIARQAPSGEPEPGLTPHPAGDQALSRPDRAPNHQAPAASNSRRTPRAGEHRSAAARSHRAAVGGAKEDRPTAPAAGAPESDWESENAGLVDWWLGVDADSFVEMARRHGEPGDAAGSGGSAGSETAAGAVDDLANADAAGRAVIDHAETARLEVANLEKMLAQRELALRARGNRLRSEREISVPVIRGKF